MQTIKVNFQNSNGVKLSARLEFPIARKPHNFAIFAHCFTCNKNLKAIHHISHALCQRGIAVLRFDFTGLGESEGDFADTNFSSNIQDLVAAADFLHKNYQAPSLLIGHSLGGAAVLAVKQHLPTVRAVATVGAPYQPEHVAHLIGDAKETIEREGVAHVKIAGRSFRIKKQFLEDITETRTFQHIQSLGAALLVLHAPEDEIVGIENATQIFKAAHHPRSFISLDNADHLLSKSEDSSYVGESIAAWASRYLEIPKAPSLSTDLQVVGVIGTEKYAMDFKVGKHQLRADEPQSVGGQDLGPDPYQYLLVALGACTGMTLRMYADRKQWDLKEVSVHLKHEKTHAKDCETCETKEGKIDQIQREITLEGNLDEAQHKKLIEIADKCPVHRTLHSEVNIVTTLRN